MGAGQSKGELLYEQVKAGNVQAIKALRLDGAGLEWMDKEGKTPLILACTLPELLPVAKVLIELGANVNACRPGIDGGTLLDYAANKGLEQTVNLVLSHHTAGSRGGTPLHHAANKGLDQTVSLLLSHGANPMLMNRGKTALDLARAKKHWKVVRAIESHISLFSGWLRELHGPSILEAFAPNLVSRKIWAVVLPCDARSPGKPVKLNLAIYPDLQVIKPLVVIALWKAQIEEPKFSQSDPAVVIVDKGRRRLRKFLCAHEGDRQQLLLFYNACRGIPQVNNCNQATPVVGSMPSPFHAPKYAPATSTGPQASGSEDLDLAMAINASIQSALEEGMRVPGVVPSSPANTTYRAPPASVVPSERSTQGAYNQWNTLNPAQTEPQPSSSSSQLHPKQSHMPRVMPSAQPPSPPASIPSAPPIIDNSLFDGLIQNTSLDSENVVTTPIMDSKRGKAGAEQASGNSETCVICLDAPVEGACVPCGHMAGCMHCLHEIKAKKWGCPVCRAEIVQVIKLYAV